MSRPIFPFEPFLSNLKQLIIYICNTLASFGTIRQHLAKFGTIWHYLVPFSTNPHHSVWFGIWHHEATICAILFNLDFYLDINLIWICLECNLNVSRMSPECPLNVSWICTIWSESSWMYSECHLNGLAPMGTIWYCSVPFAII